MRNVFSLQPKLEDPGAYPQTEWFTQTTKYWQYFYHFDGDLFDETVGEAEKFPLKLNIYKLAAMMHCGFLFGEVADNSEPLVQTIIEPWGQNSSQADYDLGRKLTDIVNRVWYESDGRGLQQENGIISQVAGGCVFDVASAPGREEEGFLPLRIGQTMPYYFFPVWEPTNHSQLLEAIIAFPISALQAKLYGVDKGGVGNDLQYQEHWKRDDFRIEVEGQVITYKGLEMQGRPIGGFVPYTYIPHIRAGEFYGESLFEGKDNLAKEVNARWADLGDVVADNARQMAAIWNSQRPTIRRLGRTQPVIDLGQELPGMGGPPGIKFPTAIQTSTGSVQYANNLLSLARTEAFCPPVVFGVDEGSQRSYLTLAIRMIPLIVHIRQERTLWTVGLNQMARHILRICAEQDIEGVKPEDLARLKIWQDWAPILPRDRETETNEVILRFQANLITMEQALLKLGDIKDIKTAMNLIKDWMEYKAEVEAMAKPASPFEGAGSDGTQAGLNRPVQPQASIKKED